MKNIKNILLIVLGVMFINSYMSTLSAQSRVGGHFVVSCIENDTGDSNPYQSFAAGWIAGSTLYTDNSQDLSPEQLGGNGWFAYGRFGGKHGFLQLDYTNAPVLGTNISIPGALLGIRTSPTSRVELSLAVGAGYGMSKGLGNTPLGKAQAQVSINFGHLSIFGAVDTNIEFGGEYFDMNLPERDIQSRPYSRLDYLNTLRIGGALRF